MTQTCRSGTRLSALRPWPGPPSRAIVPVSAQPAAHVVSAPSSASSSRGARAVVLDELEPLGRSAGLEVRPRSPTRRAPAAANAVGDGCPGIVRDDDRRLVVADPLDEQLEHRGAVELARAGDTRAAPVGSRRAGRRARRGCAPRTRHARVTGLPPLAERLRRQRRQVARASPGGERARAGSA